MSVLSYLLVCRTFFARKIACIFSPSMKFFYTASLAVAASATSVGELIQLFGSSSNTTTTASPVEVNGKVDDLKEYFANVQEVTPLTVTEMGDVAPEGSVEETINFFETLANLGNTTRIPTTRIPRKGCFGLDCSTSPQPTTESSTTSTSTTSTTSSTTTTESTTTSESTSTTESAPQRAVVARSSPPQVMLRGRSLTSQQWTSRIEVTTNGDGVVKICSHWGCQNYLTSDDDE
jgi:hypothetical protein